MTVHLLRIAQGIPQKLVNDSAKSSGHCHAGISGSGLSKSYGGGQAKQRLDARGVGAPESIHEWMSQRQAHTDTSPLDGTVSNGCAITDADPIANGRIS